MALKWVEGFETHRNLSMLNDLYEEAIGTTVFPAGRLVGNCLEVVFSGTSLRTPKLGNNDRYYIGIAMEVDNANNFDSDVPFITIMKDESVQATLEAEDAGSNFQFKLWRGAINGTLLDTSDPVASGPGWNYFELMIKTASAGGEWELRKQGVTIMSGTGDTQGVGGSDQINRIEFNLRGSNIRIDDIYIADSSGSRNNSWLGDQVIEGLLPNATGNSEQWTAESNGSSAEPIDNYLQVDDPAEDLPDDGDYVTSDTAGHIDLYGFENLSFITGTINGVFLVARARVNGTGTRVLRFKYRDPAGAVGNGPNFNVDSGTYDNFPGVLEENPTDSSTFTVADINNGQFGIEVVS